MDNLQIKEGITENQINQLIEFTKNDETIKTFTSDSVRFASKESAIKWLNSPNLKIFTLIDQTGNLVGIAWIDKTHIPKSSFTEPINPQIYQTTTAIRIYGEYRGKGLANHFYKHILNKIDGGIWENISQDNIASIKLHEKLGFRKVSNPGNNGKIVMVKD